MTIIPRWSLLWAFSLSLSWIAPAQSPSPSLLENGFQFVLDGRIDSALELLDRQVEQYPKDPRGYRARAALLSNVVNDPSDLTPALIDYDRVLELEPQQDSNFYYQRGLLLNRMNLHVRAISDLNRTVAAEPDKPNAYLIRARSHWSLGNMAESSRDLDKAIQLSPGLADAFGLRGLIRLRQGQKAPALADLARAVRLDPASEYQVDLRLAQSSQTEPQGLSWSEFLSPEGDFSIRMPLPVHAGYQAGRYVVASELTAGHMFGVLRRPATSETKMVNLASREGRESIFRNFEAKGDKITDWNMLSFLGRRCLRAQIRGADSTDTDVTVVPTRSYVYFLACTRSLESPPFDRARQARFLGSFRVLKD